MTSIPPLSSPPGEELSPAVPEEEKVPWRWWEPLLVYIAAYFTSAILAAAIAAATKDENWRRASFIIAYEVSLLGWALAWPRFRHGASIRHLGFRSDQLAGDIGRGLGWGAVAWGVSVLAIGGLTIRLVDLFTKGPVKEPQQIDLTNPSAAVLAVTALGVIILAPLAETLFRGLLYRGLRRSMKVAPALVLSSLLFMVAHAPVWIIFPSIFFLSMFLATLLERRNSIVPSIVAHMLFNLIGFIAYLGSL